MALDLGRLRTREFSGSGSASVHTTAPRAYGVGLFNECASRDAIRHFCQGTGDPNPFYWDEEYGPPRQVRHDHRSSGLPLGTLPGVEARSLTSARRKDDHLVDLEVWGENQRQEATTKGIAVVRLPSRNVS